MRTSPNIIITGTPGVGKSTHCEQLAQAVEGMKHLDVNKVVKERQCEDGYDEDLKSVIVDEDKLLDAIEPDLEAGGQIIDCTTLYDRLKARGYGEAKLQENLDVEIMEVLLQEARDAYEEEIVVELRSDEADQIEENVERVSTWVKHWKRDHADGEGA
ncbi:factor activating pos9 [Taxawa tesnikishii (nom. ined.)]|nr:factor activating pos9 [Dothideales sp. JES 119]